jgi:hypothetical protein
MHGLVGHEFDVRSRNELGEASNGSSRIVISIRNHHFVRTLVPALHARRSGPRRKMTKCGRPLSHWLCCHKVILMCKSKIIRITELFIE